MSKKTNMSKRTKGIIITGILLVIAIATLSYALWGKTFTQEGENELASGCFDIQFTNESKALGLKNAYPMTDEEGMATESYNVTIKNTCTTTVKYDVILNTVTGNDLKDEHIKVGVENNITLLTNNATVDNKVETGEPAYKIKEGIIAAHTEQVVSIRIWMDEDTSEAEGEYKTFKSKVTIDSAVADSRLLTTKIIANNELKIEIPSKFECGEPISYMCGGSSSGSGIYQASDDDGLSYYFRGDRNELQNSVEFGGQKWKIIRINGDGTIRLILVDDTWSVKGITSTTSDNTTEPKHLGFTYDNKEGKECTHAHPCEVTYNSSSKTFSNGKFNGINSGIKTDLEKWYSDNINSVDSQIEYGTFCNDTSSPKNAYNESNITYGAVGRIGSISIPNLQCPEPKDKNGTISTYGGIYKTKIGMITVDEMNMAGLGYDLNSVSSDNYIYNSISWWTLSPYNNRSVFYSNYNNIYTDGNYPLGSYGTDFVPVINLKADIQATGTGTEEDPFVVK